MRERTESAERVIGELPLLHFWNGEWSHGGFDRAMLAEIQEHVVAELPRDFTAVETGAGLTTLLLLAAAPAHLLTVSVDPEGGLERRIREWAATHDLALGCLEYIEERSETALPGATAGVSADLCIIDGGHGWPTVFVDFCYLHRVLKSGGILLLDDLQLYSVKQLELFLVQQPDYSVLHRFGEKTVAFRKNWESDFLPDFGGQPFILEMSGLK